MTSESSEEAKKKYIEKMGEPLGVRFHALWQEIAILHINWQEYVTLFGKDEKRIEQLNQSAPAFFRMIQDELWSANLLHIARLTDSPKSAGKPNLTIRNLTDLVSVSLKMPIAVLIDKAISASEFARDWRNRVIAHRDLSLALEDGVAEPLKSASRADVKVALEHLVAVMNAVQGHYLDSSTVYDAAVRHNGALNLLYLLEGGLKAKLDQEERLKRAIESGSAEEIQKAMRMRVS